MANVRPTDPAVDAAGGPTPQFDVPYSAAGFQNNLGAALERAPEVVGDLIKSQQHAKSIGDSANVTGLMGQAFDFANTKVHDPKNGYLSLKGDAALSSYDDTIQQVKEGFAKIGAGVQNAEQKKVWDLHSAALLKNTILAVENHASKQGDVVAEDRFNTATSAMTNQLALLDPTDPNTAGQRLQAFASIRQVALTRAAQLGIGGKYQAPDGTMRDGAEDFAAKYTQQGAQVIMDRAIATENGAVSKSTLQAMTPYLGHLVSHYAKPVQEAGDRQIADGLAIRLVRETTSQTGKPDPLAAQNRLDSLFTNQKVTAAQYEHAQGRMGLLLNERTNAWNKSVDQGFQTAYTTALSKDPQTGLPMVDLNRVPTGSPTTPGTQQWLQAVAPDKYDHLKLMTLRDAKTEDRENAPASRLAELDARFQLATNPEKFASMTPAAFTSEFGSKLAPKAFESFGKLWTEHLASNAKEAPHLPPVVLDAALTTGRAAGIFPGGNQPPSKWSNGDAREAWDTLTTTLIKEADQFKRTNGVAPKVADLQSMAVNHLVGVKLKGAGLFGSDKTMTALQAEQANGGVLPGNAEVVSVPGIPAEDVERIKGLLAGAGKSVTGSSILTVYQRQAARKAAGQ